MVRPEKFILNMGHLVHTGIHLTRMACLYLHLIHREVLLRQGFITERLDHTPQVSVQESLSWIGGNVW